MPLTFPSSPTVGQQYTANNRTYQWTGYAWELVVANKITISPNAPSGGATNDLWVQTNNGGQLTPPVLSASQNDYNPGSADIYRLNASTPINITGWTAWTDGTVKLIVNVGTSAITFKFQSTSSSANNRFITPTAGDYVLAPGASMIAYWDATDSRVRVF